MDHVPAMAEARLPPMVATPSQPTGSDPVALPPDSLWRFLQQAPHLAPRVARPRLLELDE